VLGKYSSRNSRMAIDCLITILGPDGGVMVSVGTLAEGLMAE